MKSGFLEELGLILIIVIREQGVVGHYCICLPFLANFLNSKSLVLNFK